MWVVCFVTRSLKSAVHCSQRTGLFALYIPDGVDELRQKISSSKVQCSHIGIRIKKVIANFVSVVCALQSDLKDQFSKHFKNILLGERTCVIGY